MLAGHRDSTRIKLSIQHIPLRDIYASCYGARLKSFVPPSFGHCLSLFKRIFRIRKFSSSNPSSVLAVLAITPVLLAQNVNRPAKADLPREDEIVFRGLSQDSSGAMRYLHKNAQIETSDMRISADEIEY